ncbi:MAG TPA: DUF2608 domain-containing protein [Gammaproteobacteria bacterium]|nr:DUF2608 domain-containing protein [Gammaproteobacteria bacterium]
MSSDFQFLEAKTTREFINCLSDIPQNAIIFIDIDDTIITPVSKTFRKPPYNELIDEIKKNKDKYPNHVEIVSNWRLQRKVMLIDENWPFLLKQLKENFVVYGLTKIGIGQFGNIESMEKWRYQELKSLGIEFPNRLNIPEGTINGASFYKGLFMTGVNSKSQTIFHYSQYFKTNTMVLLDDREEYLEDVRQFCEKHTIRFIGILFKGLEKLCDEPDPSIALFQKEYLIQHAEWLEDEKAMDMIKQNKKG